MVNTLKSFSVLSFLLLLCFSSASAQRGVTYESLVRQERQQSVYFDYFTLPGKDNNTVRFVTTFRIDYNSLPFKKMDDPDDKNRQFFSLASMSIEVFKAENSKKKRDDFSIEGLTPVNRSAWKDTAYAESYEQTQSNNNFLSGHLISNLKPGNYSYILQFSKGDEVDGQTSRRREIKILPYNKKNQGNVLFVESKENDRLRLLNFGNNVYYGKDFYAFIHLPNYAPNLDYRVTVSSLEVSREDTSVSQSVFSQKISSQDVYRNVNPKLIDESNNIFITLPEESGNESYALAKIPNRNFPNAVYRLQVNREGQKAPVAQTIYRSRWINMPASLLNVDIAIEMLRFIVDESTLKKLRGGSNKEKEEKFREFWSERDPTPDTEFNELMAEYYRRIDYAYEQFSTVNTSGYNTDRGKIYITFGPPQNIERKFPPGEPALEIWTYKDREFIFRAVSGFGDFELISK